MFASTNGREFSKDIAILLTDTVQYTTKWTLESTNRSDR